MSIYKYGEQFARDMAAQWLNGNRKHIRTTIRNLRNKAQAAFIAASVALELTHSDVDRFTAADFVRFMHPNN